MFKLDLKDVAATLENINCRTEKNGPDKVPAADLKVSCVLATSELAAFSPDLEALLFIKEKDLAGERVTLRDVHMVYPLSRDEAMTGATFSVDYGVGKPMTFGDAEVNQFRITPREGGSFVLGFRVQCKPDKAQIGSLYELQETGITIALTPPEALELAA